MQTLKILSLIFAALLSVSSCGDDKKSSTSGTGGGTDFEDISVVDGKVKFYIVEDEGTPRKAMGVKSRLSKVLVNGQEYTPQKEDDGRLSITVNASNSGEYTAVWYNSLSKNWYGSSPSSDVKVPYSQFYGTTATGLQDFPMWASYSKETGNRLVFRDAFAVLNVELSGDASVTSINVSNSAGGALAGLTSYKPSISSLVISKGVAFANLNCITSNGPVPLGGKRSFQIMLCPGTYRDGLQLRVCDSRRLMHSFTVDVKELKANEVVTVSETYSPEQGLLLYEGFDNFVWGGDYVGGEKIIAFAPSDETVTANSSAELTGYENAFVLTTYDNPGCGFVQSNTWDECSSTAAKRRTVGSSHRMSESWVRSRGLEDYVNLFRCQERPGYLEIGAATTARGIMKTPKAQNVGNAVNINGTYSFDICLKHDFDDAVQVVVEEGGIIRSCSINGKALDLSNAEFDCVYKANMSYLTIPASHFTKSGAAAAAKTWDHVELAVEGLSNGSVLEVTSLSSASGSHGIYLDNLRLDKTSDVERGSVRILSWNIQNGMWADQANNYDNFVKWVKAWNPDICIWCEASSIYKDGTDSSAPSADRFLPDGWAALAARYGHKYTAIGGFRDNYPQVVTSKYPLTTLLKITDTDQGGKPIAHGAGLHSVTVNGREIYIATLHTWPQAYAYGVATADRDKSAAEHGGDYYRQFEMDYVVAHTKNAPEYAAQKDWIFAGDLNSRSRLDNWFYKYDDNSTLLITQDVVLQKTDYVDVMQHQYEGNFVTSTQGNARIDYVYMSPSLAADVKEARVIMDAWTTGYLALKTSKNTFYGPSDHRPLLIDLK